MKKRVWVLALALWMLLSQSVWGVGTLNADTSVADVVTLTAELGSTYANRQASIEVLYPGQSLTGAIQPKETFSWLGQVKLNEDGAFSVSLMPGNVAGRYTARVKVRGAKQGLSQTFLFAPSTAVGDLILELSGLDPAAEASRTRAEAIFATAEEGLLSDAEILGLYELDEYETFTAMKPETQKKVAADMLTGFAAVGTKSDMQKLFAYSVRLETLLTLKASEQKAYITQNKEALGLTASVWCDILFGDGHFATESNQTAFAEWLAAHEWTQEEKRQEGNQQEENQQTGFATAFDEGVFLTLLSNLQTNGELQTLIEAAPEWLTAAGAEVETYLGLDSRLTVNSSVCGGNYSSLQAFVTAFNSACAANKKGGSSSTVTSGGGNRGGGSGSSRGQTVVSGTAQYQPEAIPLLTASYGDIENVTWAHEAIEYLTDKEILSGREVGKFYPNETVKREEFAKMLTLAFGLNSTEKAEAFTDVPEDAWFYSYVSSAAAGGIVTGYDGIFGVGLPLSRQDAAVMLYRAALQNGKTFEGETETAFADEADIADYAKEAVAALTRSGIISGISATEFAPQKNITRAEAAKLLYLLVK